jgi:chromosome segregation ATPase
LRLTDILNELTRQLNSLNRQAKKAERYQQVASELKARSGTRASVSGALGDLGFGR